MDTIQALREQLAKVEAERDAATERAKELEINGTAIARKLMDVEHEAQRLQRLAHNTLEQRDAAIKRAEEAEAECQRLGESLRLARMNTDAKYGAEVRTDRDRLAAALSSLREKVASWDKLIPRVDVLRLIDATLHAAPNEGDK